jgi:hypothetical protein
MSREHLPNRRPSINFNFEHRGLSYTATYSCFADGRVAEVFVNNHKVNSAVDIDARDSAVILSFALQHGADLSLIARALSRDPQGKPTGLMGAVVDLIIAELVSIPGAGRDEKPSAPPS